MVAYESTVEEEYCRVGPGLVGVESSLVVLLAFRLAEGREEGGLGECAGESVSGDDTSGTRTGVGERIVGGETDPGSVVGCWK